MYTQALNNSEPEGRSIEDAGRAAQFYEQRNRGSGRGFRGEPHGNPGGGNGFGGRAREAFRAETRVVSDQDAGAWFFRAHYVTRDRVRHGAHVREGKIFGDDGAPAVGAKSYVAHDKPV